LLICLPYNLRYVNIPIELWLEAHKNVTESLSNEKASTSNNYFTSEFTANLIEKLVLLFKLLTAYLSKRLIV
jgi:hypothetical protein